MFLTSFTESLESSITRIKSSKDFNCATR